MNGLETYVASRVGILTAELETASAKAQQVKSSDTREYRRIVADVQNILRLLREALSSENVCRRRVTFGQTALARLKRPLILAIFIALPEKLGRDFGDR